MTVSTHYIISTSLLAAKRAVSCVRLLLISISIMVGATLWLELEVSGEDVIHKIVKVGSINQSFSLVAWVHGSPAELVINHLTLHEAPHRATHHRHWLLARQDQEFTHCINPNSLPEELACMHVLMCQNSRKPNL